MCREAPTAAEAQTFGLTVEEASDHLKADVWPDNVETVNVFASMTTQWRYSGMGSAMGLEYGSIEPVLRLRRVPRKRWTDVFDGLQTMEAAAVAELAKGKPGG